MKTRKVMVILVIGLLYFSSLAIINTTLVVEAEPDEEILIDGLYIHNLTKKLSWTIFNAPLDHGIQKARYYGTEGEWYAADLLAREMEDNLSLYDPTEEYYIDLPYQEKLDVNKSYTNKLEILARKMVINNLTNDSSHTVDCFISPRWTLEGAGNGSYFQPFNKSKLTQNFSYSGLKLGLANFLSFNYSFLYDFLNNTFEVILDNISNNNYEINYEFLESEFEKYFNFSFKDIEQNPENMSDLPWYNASILTWNDFLFIEENKGFNPDYKSLPNINSLYNNITDFLEKLLKDSKDINIDLNDKVDELRLGVFYAKWIKEYCILRIARIYQNCKGIIRYDYDNDVHDNIPGVDYPLPVLYINGSEGEPLKNNLNNYTIDFWINQSWNNSVVSYNVIGQMNGTNSDKTVIISSLYDSVWAQGTTDSAIGTSIVLAIAKYMKELKEIYGVIPKYNVKFVGFSGEELGMIGAKDYNKVHNESIWAFIDLNQLGFTQTNPYQRTVFNVATNRLFLKPFVSKITSKTNYEERTGDVTDLHVGTYPLGSLSNNLKFANRRILNPYFKIVMFLEDHNWTRHHRDGLKHTDGDSMQYYNWTDVNVTAEMVWNVTKYLAYNPDCWFDGDPVYTTWESDDDNKDADTLNVTFNLDTIIPREPVSVRLILHPKFKIGQTAYAMLYRHRARKNYNVTPDGLSGYINVSLPENFPSGDYVAKLYLCNSTGNARLDALESLDVLLDGKMVVKGAWLMDELRDITGIDILEDLAPNLDEIWDELRLNIIDWIQRIPDVRKEKIRNLLIDIIGYYSSFGCDSRSSHSDFTMAPPNNDPPEIPTILSGTYNAKAGESYEFTTSTTDDENDPIRFQWKWGPLSFSSWSKTLYGNNAVHKKEHTWYIKGSRNVKVRAKDRGANGFTDWSEPWEVDVSPACVFNIQSQFNHHSQGTSPQNTVVVSNPATYEGCGYELGERPVLEYNFSGLENSSETESEYTFTKTGLYYVNLSYNETIFYNQTVNVVNISSGFLVSRFGAQPNQTIIFNDTTLSNNTIVNWTWDMGDGNISYERNISYSYTTEGTYNVTLNVTDENSEFSTCYYVFYVERTPPEIFSAPYSPVPGCIGSNVTVYADFFENQSGLNMVSVNISYPNGSTGNYSMYESWNSTHDYEYVVNDVDQVGWYYYTIWVTDCANNSNNFPGCGFQVLPAFGYSSIGNNTKNIMDNMSGSNFTAFVNGTAESISAYIHSNLTSAPKTKCMIYRVNDSKLIGTTEEKTYNTGDEPEWVTYNFSEPKPNLTTNTQYILACWSNDTCNLSYDNTTNNADGRYNDTISYGSPPQEIEWVNEPRLYSIYCTYSTTPEVTNATASPDPIGFGYNTTITAEVEHYYTLVEKNLILLLI